MSTRGTTTTTTAAARIRFSRIASSTFSPPLERMVAGPVAGHHPVDGYPPLRASTETSSRWLRIASRLPGLSTYSTTASKNAADRAAGMRSPASNRKGSALARISADLRDASSG